MHRGWQDSPVFKKQPYTEREAWEWLISEAFFENQQINILENPVLIKRGQVSHSLKFLSDKWEWPKTNVSRFLEKLKKWTMITMETGPGQNIITICNYDIYQSDENESGTEADRIPEQRRTGSGPKNKKLRNKEEKNIGIPKPENVENEVWESFLVIRKAKKAPVTKLVIQGINGEARIAGISLNAALKECCVRGWQSFKADWYNKPQDRPANSKSREENLAILNLQFGDEN